MLGFVAEHLVRGKNTHVMSTDLLAAFNGWLKVRGHREWSDQTLAGRLKDHEAWQGITYQQILASKDGLSRPTWPAATIPKRYRAWVGVRFGVSTDEQDDDPKPVETDTKPQDAQGAQGTPENPHEEPKIKTPDHPVHPVQSNVSRPNGSAYLNGQCRDCGKRPHSAGRPRCDECYRAYLITIDGYDR